MRSGLLLLMVAAMIAAGCRTVSYQTADSAAVEPAVFSYAETALADALAAFLQGRLIEEKHGQGSAYALQFYDTAADRAPGSHTVHSRIAVEAMRRGDLNAAIKAMEASYAAQPEDPIRQIDLGAMYQLGARQEEATDLYLKALVQQPANTALYVALADMYFARGENDKALDILADGFPLADDTEALTAYLYQKVRRLVARDAVEDAIACLELLAKWDKEERAEIGYMLGELHIAREQMDAAQKAFYRAIEHPGAPAAAFLRLGALLMEQENSREAIRVIRAGGEEHPDLISFPFALGGLYAEEGQYEEALLAYETAVRIAQQTATPPPPAIKASRVDKNLLIAIAVAQERLKRFEDAAETLQQLLEQNPDSHIAMNFLAYMWAELDVNLEEAYALSKRSLEMDPDNGAYLDTLGWIYYRKGNLEQALDYLVLAREQLGPDPEIILHFGDVYAAKGDMERAAQYWKESLRGDPTPENRAWEQLKQEAGMDPQEWLRSQDNDAGALVEKGAGKDPEAPTDENDVQQDAPEEDKPEADTTIAKDENTEKQPEKGDAN